MKILIATDGNLDVSKTASAAARLAAGDTVTVLTAVEVPRKMLGELRGLYGEQPAPTVHSDAEYVSASPTGSDVSRGWPGDDAMLDRYISDLKETRCAAIAAALREQGVEPTVTAVETEDAVGAIMEQAKDYDIVIVGSHGSGRFEGMLGSVTNKLARRSKTSVLIIR